MAETGDVLNPHMVSDVQSGPVAASTNLVVGWVKQSATGWVVAAAGDDSRLVYWNPRAINNSSGAAGDKIATCYGEGTIFVGECEGAIAVSANIKVGTASHQTIVNTVADVATIEANCGVYLGHVQERTESGTAPTDGVDTETDTVFLLHRAV